MQTRWRTAGMVAGVAGLLMGAAAVVPASAEVEEPGPGPLSVAGRSVPLALAGELVVWGEDTYGQGSVPAEYANIAFSQVLPVDDAVLALTAGGRVVGWGGNQFRVQQIPTVVTAEKVAQIAYSPSGYGGAVTRDGRVLVWGPKRARPTPLDVPAGLTGVTQLDLREELAVAVKGDGTVVAWGGPANGVTDVPPGLRASQILQDGFTVTALTTDGSIVQWGALQGMQGRPAATSEPGSVKAIARRYAGVLAWLADDSLVTWGNPGNQMPLPATVAAADPLLLGHSNSPGFVMVDRDRVIHQWASGADGGQPPFGEAPEGLPDGLSGRPISHLTLGNDFSPTTNLMSGGAIVTRLLPADAPRLSGTAKVGSVVTGVPGVFSASPESVASQWLVGGVPVSGAGGPLTVTSGMVGKTIAYRSTATKTGEPSVSSTSVSVVVPKATPPAPQQVSSSTRVVSVKVAKRAAKLDVSGKVGASRSPAGRAVVTILKGRKVIVSKTVTVAASGALKLSVKKFGKLSIKKTRSKSRTGYRGAYTVTIKYLGTPRVKGSAGVKKFKVK
ncbi:hypothetical protein [Nocardioides lianchengensis]|uniref:Regulator of chromosome condensation (RCC1) repeat-containing protein n=1 Tax=Nocardioides lianchengensis TaxID=1045774 RepID=A0A1G7B5Q3_9ACTN|nr:hypothetical protein [Nocardioides lianchengensis]NYG10108.1 hypothetical protein [Nocardioides lianchengensis]SDE22361.1 hypothetical protein SAMN05421872_11739 [Nocardioides lianchengensis]